MAKTKFSIDKRTLIEEQADGAILTRVPQSNMEYYLVLHNEDIISQDEKTIIVEWDSEQEVDIVPCVKVEGKDSRRPTLKEAISSIQNSNGVVSMKAGELYNEYYEYEKNLDPEQKKLKQEQRDARRQQALQKLEQSSNTKSNGSKSSVNVKTSNKKNNSVTNTKQTEQVAQQQVLTPAQQMAQQRARIQHYSKQQFREIMKGVRQKVDTTLYKDIRLSHQQMKELRLAAKAGLDVRKYNSPFISAKHMREIRLGAKNGVRMDIDKLNHSLYNAEQIHEMRIGFQKNIEVKRYLDPAYNADQMKEIRLALQAGLDTTQLENIHLTAEQMRSMRHRMIVSNLEEILKRMFEDIRSWISDVVSEFTEKIQANTQNREPMTPEQRQEARINEAVEDIKETLIQSEVLPESAYEDMQLDEKIREQVEELIDYMENKSEQDIDKAVADKAQDICQVAEAEIEEVKEEKVVSIHQSAEVNISPEQAKAISEEIDKQLQDAYEMDQEVVMEQEDWAMIQ